MSELVYELAKCKSCDLISRVSLGNRNCKFCRVSFVGQGVDFEKMAIEESRIKYDEWLNTVFWILGGIAFVIALLYMQRYELLENPFYFSSLIFLALVFTRLIKPLSRFIAKKQYPDSFNV